jgi:hypothetical protein
LDFWNGKQWLTISISSVITVKDHRLLIKKRLDLLQGLENSECPNIMEELKLQSAHWSHIEGKKRQADNLVSPVRKVQRRASRSRSKSPPSITVQQSPTLAAIRHQDPLGKTSKTQVPNDETPEPRSSSPNISQVAPINSRKQWPYDFYVCQISEGIALVREVEKSRSITVEEAFKETFLGSDFKKSTFYDHEKYWKRDAKNPKLRRIQNYFIDLGESPMTTYRQYWKAIKNPDLFLSQLPEAAPSVPKVPAQSSSSASDSGTLEKVCLTTLKQVSQELMDTVLDYQN